MIRLIRPAAYALAVALAAPCVAQSQVGGGGMTLTTGLAYNPGGGTSLAVVPTKGGPYGDSLAAIVQRDLDYSNRFTILRLDNTNTAVFYDAFKGLSYDFFTGLNSNFVIEMTAIQTRVNVKVHDVARKQSIAVADFSLPASGLSRDWRMAVHMVSDSIQALVTGAVGTSVRGIAATRIAYVNRTLRVVDSDGAYDIPVPTDSQAVSPAWDSSGERLVFSTFGVGARVMMVNLQTGQAKTIQPYVRDAVPTTPIFAPDGNSVFFTSADPDGTSSLWRLPLDGSGRVQIESGKGNSNPTVSPDGRRIAFSTDRLGHNEVYIIDADGTNATWITNIAGDAMNERTSYRSEPDWSPDGVTIALQTRIQNRFQIMTVNLRDNSAKRLTDAGENQSPSWAPDGRHIVFTSSRSGADQLWIMDTQSFAVRQLTNTAGVKYPAWSPRLMHHP